MSSPTFSTPSSTTGRWANDNGLLTVDDAHMMAKLLANEVFDTAGNALVCNEVIGEDLFRFHKLSGDIDGDGIQTDADIDTLFSRFGNSDYDLTGDSQTNFADVTKLVEDILGTFFGDANLDGVVDNLDLTILSTNWQQSGMEWGDADFNGDGTVDDLDLTALASNWDESNLEFELIDLGDPPAWS